MISCSWYIKMIYCIDISCTAQEKCAKILCEIHSLIIFCFTQATVMYIKISNYIRGVLENSHEWKKEICRCENPSFDDF